MKIGVSVLFPLAGLLNLGLPLFGEDIVRHPDPKDPTYISQFWYGTLINDVPVPPGKRGSEQLADEAELAAYQKTRTKADCDRAKGEVIVSLGSFFGQPAGPLAKDVTAKLQPFFETIRNDADYFIQKLKKALPRERPFTYLTNLTPCVPREVTNAYPSGHAVLAKLFALILTDMFPEHKAAFEERAKVIGDDRVLAGMHHRSDVEVGRKIGELIYAELKKSPAYQKDYARYTAPVSAAKK